MVEPGDEFTRCACPGEGYPIKESGRGIPFFYPVGIRDDPIAARPHSRRIDVPGGMPSKDQLYVGWTSPGEWIKYTVFVKQTGTYTLGMMYTASQGGKISISVNDIDATGLVEMPSTYVNDDPIHWRQWHHWNYLKDFGEVKLEKGIQIITLSTRETGQMNYSYIDFTPVKDLSTFSTAKNSILDRNLKASPDQSPIHCQPSTRLLPSRLFAPLRSSAPRIIPSR